MSKILIITGPTASGKSDVALKIAMRRNAVIINADSIQVYKEIPILSAQPSISDMREASHVLYGFLSNSDALTKRFCLAHWVGLAVNEIHKALNEGVVPIVVGGTGMYIKALTDGFCEIPPVPDDFYVQNQDIPKEEIVDFVRGHDLDAPLDTQRLMRNYALIKLYGNPLKFYISKGNKRFFDSCDFVKTVLLPPREEIYKTCNSRFLDMLEGGAIEEVKRLANETEISTAIGKATGFGEILSYLKGSSDAQTMIAKSQQSTRNYAKRQTTWVCNQFGDFKFFSNKADLISSV